MTATAFRTTPPPPRRRLVWALLLLAAASAADAQERADDAPALLPFEPRVEAFQLDNGWSFLLLPRRDAPVVSFETWVDTGSRHDPPGASGLANLMKNMLFKGSDRIGTRDWPAERLALDEVDAALEDWLALADSEDQVARAEARARLENARASAASFIVPGEFSRLLEDAGGAATLNGYTTADSTRFTVSLPANQFELWCWLESERFERPVLREFYAERDAVIEDRRGRIEADARSLLGEQLLFTCYSAHPYRRPTVGLSSDLPRLTRAAAREFFEMGFGARHMTTAIVGDFDASAVTGMLERYFGSLPPGPLRVAQAAVEPPQESERRVEVVFDAPPEVQIAWHAPPFAHADTPAIRIALRLLAYAPSSRLERRLIRDDGSASEITITPALGGDELRGLVMIRAVPITGVSTHSLELAIYEEIETLTNAGPSPEELAGVKRAARFEYLRGLRDNASLARGLLENEAKGGDWRSLFRAVDRLEAVSAQDVQRVLSTYFVESKRNVATLVPRTTTEAPRESE